MTHNSRFKLFCDRWTRPWDFRPSRDLVCAKGDYWKQIRSACVPIFEPRHIEVTFIRSSRIG
jgi:hypothetical protein